MVADKRDKSAAVERAPQERRPLFFNELQFLMHRIADGKNHSAALGKLGKERRGNRGSSSSNKDGVEQCKFRQTQRAVAAVHVYIGVTETRKAFRCRQRKLVPAFNCKYFPGQTGKNRGLVAAACTYFQDAIAGA